MKRISLLVFLLALFIAAPVVATAGCCCSGKSNYPYCKTVDGDPRCYPRCDEIKHHVSESSYDCCCKKPEPKPEKEDCCCSRPKYDPCKKYEAKDCCASSRPKYDPCQKYETKDCCSSSRPKYDPCNYHTRYNCTTSLPMISARTVSSSSYVSEAEPDPAEAMPPAYGSDSQFRYKVSVRRYK